MAGGVIFNIQKFSLHDGPGIRTLVFLSGCPLRCLWCANPEGQGITPALAWQENLCATCGRCADHCKQGVHAIKVVAEKRKHVMHRKRCTACGGCVTQCTASALKLWGQETSAAQLLNTVLQDRIFYETSGGGVTLGGGDPVAQPDFARELLELFRQNGLHTAIETSAFTDWPTLAHLAALTDLMMVDIKHMDDTRHRESTGRSNEIILDNIARLLATRTRLIIRIPVIPGFNDSLVNMSRTADFLAEKDLYRTLEAVELLPYHAWGEAKYGRLGLAFNPPPSKEVDLRFLNEAAALFTERGLKIKPLATEERTP